MKIEIKFFTRESTYKFRYVATVPKKLENLIEVGKTILVNSKSNEIVLAKVVSKTIDNEVDYRDLNKKVLAIIEDQNSVIVDETRLNELTSELNQKLSELKNYERKVYSFTPIINSMDFVTPKEKEKLKELAQEVYDIRIKIEELS